MKNFLRISVLTIAAAALTFGCATEKHRSVRTYEHDEAPPPEQSKNADEGEWQMESKGEMVVD